MRARLLIQHHETDLTDGRVIRGAKRFVRGSRIKTAHYVADPRASHFDPLVAAPKPNVSLRTVVPFLKKRRGRMQGSVT